MDANLRPPDYDAARVRFAVTHADVFKASAEELPEVAGLLGVAADPRALFAFGPEWVCVTRGADGAELHHRDGRRWEAPGRAGGGGGHGGRRRRLPGRPHRRPDGTRRRGGGAGPGAARRRRHRRPARRVPRVGTGPRPVLVIGVTPRREGSLKMRKALIPLLLVLAVLTAGCFQLNWLSAPDGDEPTTTLPGIGDRPTTTLPIAGRFPVYIDAVDFLMLESWPVQVHAIVRGNLPTPCHALAWNLAEPDADGRIVLTRVLHRRHGRRLHPGAAALRAEHPGGLVHQRLLRAGGQRRGVPLLHLSAPPSLSLPIGPGLRGRSILPTPLTAGCRVPLCSGGRPHRPAV